MSHLYSFTFARRDWTRTHARQVELQQYLDDVVDRFGLRSYLRSATTVEGATWHENTCHYDLGVVAFSAVISATAWELSNNSYKTPSGRELPPSGRTAHRLPAPRQDSDPDLRDFRMS